MLAIARIYAQTSAACARAVPAAVLGTHSGVVRVARTQRIAPRAASAAACAFGSTSDAFLILTRTTQRWGTSRDWSAAAVCGAALATGAFLCEREHGPAACEGTPATHGFRSSRYDSLADLVEDVFPSICKLQGFIGGHRVGGGSGFLVRGCVCVGACTCVREDVYVVTNDHVISAMIEAGARDIQAEFDDGRVYLVSPVASDEEADIAVARLLSHTHTHAQARGDAVAAGQPAGVAAPRPSPTGLKPLRIGNPSTLRRGDGVVVLGAPLGGSLLPTAGVLSAAARFAADNDAMMDAMGRRGDMELICVDAHMSSGSSGGPIVNHDGEVVGISVMVQQAAFGVGAVNFGVSMEQAAPIIRQLINSPQHAVTRAFIGMTILHVNALASAREHVPLLPPSKPEYITGLLVTYAMENHPAHVAGIRDGDVILEINGRKMVHKGDYFAALGPVYEPGKVLDCLVYRPARRASGGSPGLRRRVGLLPSRDSDATGAEGELFRVTIRPAPRNAEQEQSSRFSRRRVYR